MLEQNQYLIQYLLRNGIIRYNDANNLLRRCADQLKERHQDIRLAINELNEKLSHQLLHIDLRTCEISGEKVCVIVNKCIDDISKSMPGHTPGELDLFQAIMETIMTSDAKWVSAIVCLNLTTKLNDQLTKDMTQTCIDTWTENGYLVKEDGLIYLGARTISEFESYFKKQYSARMTTCKLCTDSVYYGKICANCYEVTHTHCLKIFWKKDKKCPSCKKLWSEAEGRTYDEDSVKNEENNESMETDDQI